MKWEIDTICQAMFLKKESKILNIFSQVNHNYIAQVLTVLNISRLFLLYLTL